MTATLPQIQKWREAHKAIELDDVVIAAAGPFPSLHVNDFAVYLESKGGDAAVLDFVRGLGRETAWAYDGWKRAVRDSVAGAILADMLNNATAIGEAASHYDFVRRFIQDYAKANGHKIDAPPQPGEAWADAFGGGTDAGVKGVATVIEKAAPSA